jgi:hypothetical protein
MRGRSPFHRRGFQSRYVGYFFRCFFYHAGSTYVSLLARKVFVINFVRRRSITVVSSLLCSTAGGGCSRMDVACRCYAGAVLVPSPQTRRYLRLRNSLSLHNIDIKNPRFATCSVDAHRGPAILVAVGLLAELRAVVPWRQQIARASPTLLHPAAFFVAVDNVQVHAGFALQGHDPPCKPPLSTFKISYGVHLHAVVKSMSCKALGCTCKPTENHLLLFLTI